MPNLKLEQFHVDQFCRLQTTPEPDFLVEVARYHIAIEHTRPFRLRDANETRRT